MGARKTLSKKSNGVLLIFLFLLCLSGKDIYSQQSLLDLERTDSPDYYQMRKVYQDLWKDVPENQRKGWKQFKRWEYFWDQRTYPTGKFPDERKILNDWKNYEEVQKNKNTLQSANWNLIGPQTIPGGTVRQQGLGRINCVRFSPTNPDELWVGAASGGVWKTTDGGQSWRTFPFTNFLSLGVSDIAISKTNPNVVYVATGDADGTLPMGDQFYSIGLIKTTDGGASWNTTNLSYFLAHGKLLARVLVRPDNPDVVIVGTSDGIMKSTDGGATWENKQSGGNFIDLEFKPGNPDVMYASTFTYSGNAGIYKSTDGGETWKPVKTLSGCLRINLNVSPADPLYVYAIAARTNYSFHSFLASDDEGENWSELANPSTAGNVLGWYDGKTNDNTKGQGQYDLCLAINPTNADEIYIGGVNVWKSTDGGGAWKRLSSWFEDGSHPFIHADHHDLEFNGNVIYSTNDGGIAKSMDNGKTWVDITSGISITQYYRLSSSPTEDRMIIGGAQDNGTSMVKGGIWSHCLGGDGMEALIDPSNSNRMYASMYNGEIYRSNDGGKSFSAFLNSNATGEDGAWVTPYILDPNDPATLYAGYKNVWKVTNNGTTRTKLSNFSGGQINSLAAAYDSKTVYAATYNILYVYKGEVGKWDNIHSSSSAITYIAVDPNNANHVWITKSGYDVPEKVMEYDGTKWKNLTGNLPKVPVNCIVYQKDSPDRLYVGTDIGVFYSDYGSGQWEPYQDGMPHIIIDELEIHYKTKKLRAATYGRGFWEADLIDCNLPQLQVQANGELQFCQGDSVMLTAADGYSSYSWSNGQEGKTIVVKDNGMYSCTADNGSGCKTRSSAVNVVVNVVPKLEISSTVKPVICQNDSLELSASMGFTTYKWSTGETSRKIWVKTPGDYSVTATTKDGCSSAFSTNIVTVTAAEKPSISRDGNWLSSTDAKTYQWYADGKKILNAKGKSYLATKTGVYTVVITDTNDCESSSDAFNLEALGVDDNADASLYFSVNPNPGNGLFNIDVQSETGEKVEIKVSNITGSEIMTLNGTVDNNRYTNSINLESYPAGVYIFYVTIGDKKFTQRVVKL